MEPENGQRSGSDTLLVLQPKSFRSFNNKDEYLYAMKEDLADWFTCLYKIEINGDLFFEVIETGILLCKHANEVINFTKERREKGIEIIMKSYFVTHIPENLIQYKENNVKPGSFLARDNISNFISWCRLLGIPDDLRFETEDLVTRKNEKSVILCLLEVARVGAKLGMLAPTIVQMEEEIDAELAGEPPPQIITCDLKSLDEMVSSNVFRGWMMTKNKIYTCFSLVRLLVGYCTCPIQFAMVKVGDGKYQVGESKTLIFVRILRKHVMVRVGGGWDTLERYLDKHDPCRCNGRFIDFFIKPFRFNVPQRNTLIPPISRRMQ
ncbi:hypothetical protein LOTGIDRAFT_103845 [Lottia gigantea]|uniref:GAR domain-containing protein n=1 Tax=Lottia gigantea TaxID=225164 RepID=V4AVA3_LOTGI|nr:hypothetical protein LOTGIDRAFT_103845 [Lottia gigantea]ESO97761.1 hypothetical protein LOTGIDRAFT_103845 [Lottia gigantea]